MSAKAKIRLPPLPTVRDLLKLYGLRAMKQLSQNFLLDQRITDKIVKVGGKIGGGHVLEVGPGPGSITRSILLRSPASLTLIEKDYRFQPTLEMLSDVAPCPVDMIYGDALRLNMEAMFPSEAKVPWTSPPPRIFIIGNLPFSVATPLIVRWIKEISQRSSAWGYGRVSLTLTFQKEVAERLSAPILCKQRCRLSVMAQNWCHVEHLFNIPGKAFVPKPDVDVGVVRFVPLIEPVVDMSFDIVEKVTRCLFSGKQKYLTKSLGTLFPKGAREELTQVLLKESDVSPTMRAVQVTVPEVGRLVQAYSSIVDERPSLAKYNHRHTSDISVYDEDDHHTL